MLVPSVIVSVSALPGYGKWVLTFVLDTFVDVLSTQIIVRKIIVFLLNQWALPFDLTVIWTFMLCKTVHNPSESHPHWPVLCVLCVLTSFKDGCNPVCKAVANEMPSLQKGGWNLWPWIEGPVVTQKAKMFYGFLSTAKGKLRKNGAWSCLREMKGNPQQNNLKALTFSAYQKDVTKRTEPKKNNNNNK